MLKVKKIFNELRDNTFLRNIIELVLLVLLFNINKYIGIFFTLIVLIEIILSKSPKNMLYIFLFLSFNDDILKLDILNGSISRIVMIFIFIKLLIYIYINKIKPNKVHIGILVFFIISSLMGINDYKDILIVLINIFIFVLFSIAINFKDKRDIELLIEELCYTIIVSVSCSIIFGMTTGNFLRCEQDNKIIYRFNGTYEPNFMCMYVNLGILSLFTIKDKINKYLYYLLASIFINVAIMTISITGIGTLVFSIIIYFILNIKELKKLLKDFLIIGVISLIIFSGCKLINWEEYIKLTHQSYISYKVEDTIYNYQKYDVPETEDDYSGNGLLARAKRIKNLLKNGKIDEITSGRTSLTRTFVKASFNRPVINILFGNNPLNKKVFNDFFNKECLSHNSYADFLYNFGIIGFVIIIYFIANKTIKNKFLNINIKDTKYSKNIKLIRIMLLIYALALTLYTKRMFLVFLLL